MNNSISETMGENIKYGVKARKLLEEDLFKMCTSVGKIRRKIIKIIFPEFSLFVDKVREYYWSQK